MFDKKRESHLNHLSYVEKPSYFQILDDCNL
jgi:hypothetical protein